MRTPASWIEHFYPGSSKLGVSSLDGTLVFYDRVNSICPDNAILLDFGGSDGASIKACTGWRQQQLLIPSARRRIGVDVDPAVLRNPYCDEAHVLKEPNGFKIPLPDRSVDMVLSDWVIEHLPAPVSSFAEIYRVLRPGGWFCARTGNVWHYSYAVANLVKNTRLEAMLLRTAHGNRVSWPKAYRANTVTRLRRDLSQVGFAKVAIVRHEPEPAYVMRQAIPFLMGVAWQRLAAAGLLPAATLLVFGKK